MISSFTMVLIVHVLAVLVMTAVLAAEAVALVHMRGATSLAEAVPWINPVPRLGLFAVSSIFLILFSGGYLVMQQAESQQAWGRVAAVAVLLMMCLGALTGKRMRAIRRGFYPGMEKSGERMTRLRGPFLKVSLCVRITVFLAIFLLVSTKPGTLVAIAMMIVAILLGLLLSKLRWSRSPVLSVARAVVGK
ncbi:MAG TPA: hypothetical protein VN577_18570 [Terriglobales bacterium]|nr:hypothetical protein [Terriglobales bacterium]